MAEGKSVLREVDAEAVRLARTLLRTSRAGALAVLDPAGGAPAVSRVGVCTDFDGTPVLLGSALALHTVSRRHLGWQRPRHRHQGRRRLDRAHG